MFRSTLARLGRKAHTPAIVGFRASEVALTFDDGPDPLYTPRLLEILVRHGVRATFFVLGRQAELYPHILKDIREAGSEIGNHSYDHPSFSLISKAEQRREIESCRLAIGRGGALLFRPPHGHTGNGAAETASRLGYRTINWSADSRDWHVTEPAGILRALEEQVKPGCIVLMHDRLETATDKRLFDRSPTLEALDSFLAQRKAGLRFLPVGEILSRSEPVTEDWDAHLTGEDLSRRKREHETLVRNHG